MNTKTGKYVIALLTVALLGTSYVLLNNQMYAASAPTSVGQQSMYTGMVEVTVTNALGEVVSHEISHNILVLAGKNFTTQQLFSAPIAAVDTPVANISLGNGTTAPNQLETAVHFGGIADCDLAPSNTLSWININNGTGTYTDGSGNVSANHKWTANCGSGTGEEVNQTMIGLTTSIFAVNTFTNVFLQANDQLNVTWYVWIT
jgi:hypothetical protein